MIHFSCDACGSMLGEERFSVTVEIKAEFDPCELTEADLDADHLAQIAAELEAQTISGEPSQVSEKPRRQKMKFDLCPACQARYAADPLGREALRRWNFSKN